MVKLSNTHEQAMAKLTSIYEAAIDDDKVEAATLVKRAIGSQKDAMVTTITPGVAAILFFDHNKQNREWNVNATLDYLRQVEDGEWEFTNQGIGFLTSGAVGDGQHRLAAIALSGAPVETLIAFGMLPKAVIALDTGRRRQAADYMHIMHPSADTGVLKRKQQIVKRAFGYMVRNQDEVRRRPYVLKGNRDTAKAIEAYDSLLGQAIEIGDNSVRGRSKPTFSAAEVAAFAFLLLLDKDWTVQRVVADVDVFQSGEDREGGNSPLFVAADLLQKDTAKHDRSSLTSRFGAAVKAFLLHEQGIKAVRVSEIRTAMKPKVWIDPSYPDLTLQKAAE